VKESEFQKWIVDLAKTHGWRVWHVPTPMKPIGGNKFVPDSRGRGLADLLMFHESPPRLIFAEVKGHDGVLSVEQSEFLRLARLVAAISGGTMRVYVWRPGVEPLIKAALAA
jgi:hypothetical protein